MLKITTMRITILGLIIVALLGSTSCRKDENKNGDDSLIEAIKNATNKQSISFSELPYDSKMVIESDYSESYVDDAKLAPKLGYEVDMSNEFGFKAAEYKQAYFDLTGRELKSWKGDKDGKDCFVFVYPITYEMPDGTTITGNTKKEIAIGIKVWYEAHPDFQQKPTLQYPIDIIYGDKIITINNEEEMKKAYEWCKGDKGDKRKCFGLIYPVNYILPDGTEVTFDGKSDIEAKRIITAWYEAHPDVAQKPVLDYPVDIKWLNGEITTINSQKQMRRAKASCDGDKERCFDLVYPVIYIMPDGSEIPVRKDTEEGWANVKAWYRLHPDAKEKPAIKFPVNIIYRDGNQLTINNQDQMKRAHKACD